MEENVDSLNESGIKKDEAMKEASPITNKENNINPNQQNTKKELSNEIKNEKVVANSSKDINPKKEIPIEKKPFNEFVNLHLLPSLILEFKERGFEVEEISLKNTIRPIAEDKCWVIYCEIKETCNFWLSFEKDDISSLKSISLCRFSQKPSIIESFLIDEKRITLKLIISRIMQRLNGQKLLGVN